MKRNNLLVAGLTVLTLVGCGSGGGDSYQAHPYDAPPISEALKNEYLTAINNARSVGRSCGEYGFYPAVSPVAWNNKLYKAALEHSRDMAYSNHFEHDGSGGEYDWTAQVQELGRGSNISDRGDNNGETILGENIAAGTVNIDRTIKIWLKSDGHCTLLMDKDNKEVGLAHAYSSASKYKNYWTLDVN